MLVSIKVTGKDLRNYHADIYLYLSTKVLRESILVYNISINSEVIATSLLQMSPPPRSQGFPVVGQAKKMQATHRKNKLINNNSITVPSWSRSQPTRIDRLPKSPMTLRMK